jgi:hypothetical protein
MSKTLEFIGSANQYIAGRMKFTPDVRVREVSDEEAAYLLQRKDRGGNALFRAVGTRSVEKPREVKTSAQKAKQKAKEQKAPATGPDPAALAEITKGHRVGAFLLKPKAIDFARTIGVELDNGLALKTMNQHTKELAARAASGLTGAALIKGLSGTSLVSPDAGAKLTLPQPDEPAKFEEVGEEEVEEDDEGLVDLVPKNPPIEDNDEE